tara:strand:+ start:9369 stop:9911 length:543 start_codon:yes stop_codon:yes gene_type:complete
MKIIKTNIDDLLLIKPKIYSDNRGHFFESWNKNIFNENIINVNFIQDNQSLSKKGVIRGLHFQNPPYAQGKLVRVIKGKVLDVALDIRKKSKSYGKYFSIELSGENNFMLWIPPGFAHGFSTLEDNTIFSYKCSGKYNKESENSILWNDPNLNINWKVKNPIISDKDQKSQKFTNFNSKF